LLVSRDIQEERESMKHGISVSKGLCLYVPNEPVTLTSQSKVRTVFDRSNAEIVGLNPARGLDVCPRFSVLCCPV